MAAAGASGIGLLAAAGVAAGFVAAAYVSEVARRRSWAPSLAVAALGAALVVARLAVAGAGGKLATITLPSPTGGANWQGGAADPETGMLYVSSVTFAAPVSLAPDRQRTDMDYLGEYGFKNVGPQGLPLAKPPWGRITAIDLNTGEHSWMAPNGSTPEFVKRHPALKGVTVPRTGRAG